MFQMRLFGCDIDSRRAGRRPTVVRILLLRFATPKRGTASLSDVEGTKQSQENPNANDTLDFQPGPAQSAEPRPVEYESLATGTRIAKDIGTDGEGKLSVENGWAKVKRAA